MARNLKKDYLKKLADIVTVNGYKFDLMNYVYNPHRNYDYPVFKKTLAESNGTYTYKEVRYFKRYDGSGCYEAAIYEAKATDKPTKNPWIIVHEKSVEPLEESRRFSLDKLLSFC